VIFDGLITEVRPMGLLVEATQIGTRGLLKREDLGSAWRIEAWAGRATHRDGFEIRMGQRIQLIVSRIDRERRFVDFKLAAIPDTTAATPGKKIIPRQSATRKSASFQAPRGKSNKDKGSSRKAAPKAGSPKSKTSPASKRTRKKRR